MKGIVQQSLKEVLAEESQGGPSPQIIHPKEESLIMGPTERQKEILRWFLTNPERIRQMRNNSGFFIIGGHMVVLKNGEEIEIIDFFRKEGFVNNLIVDGYSVRIKEESEQYREAIHFFKINTYDIPF